MKKLLLNLFLLALTVVAVSSCSEDDDGPTILLPKLDGLYVYGTNTIASEPTEPTARMALATLNPAKSSGALTAPGYYGKLMYIGANSTINIVEIDGASSSIYGAADGGTVTNGSALEFTDIGADFINGDLLVNGPAIKVAQEGLYYLFVNTVDDNFRLMRIEANMIGDATPNQWASSTSIPMIETSVNETVFEVTDVKLIEGGYKLRFNNGYEVYNDLSIATINYLGVEDYAAARDAGVNDLIYKDENIPNVVVGYYTYRLVFNAALGKWTETKTKTGDVLIDYSTYSMEIIGNATADGSFNGDGTGGYGAHVPVKAGNVYTWTFNDVPLVEDGEFIFLQDATWGGLLIDYAGAAVSGDAITAGDVIDATAEPINGEYHNFYVINGGTYDIVLVIDSSPTGGRTVTISKN